MIKALSQYVIEEEEENVRYFIHLQKYYINSFILSFHFQCNDFKFHYDK